MLGGLRAEPINGQNFLVVNLFDIHNTYNSTDISY